MATHLNIREQQYEECDNSGTELCELAAPARSVDEPDASGSYGPKSSPAFRRKRHSVRNGRNQDHES